MSEAAPRTPKPFLPSEGDRRRVPLWVTVTAVIGIVALLATALTFLALGRSAGDDSRALQEFTTVDGSVTMQVPAAWSDETAAYRQAVAETGGQSAIEGFLTLDGRPASSSDVFVTISGSPVYDTDATLASNGERHREGWEARFDDTELTESMEYTSDSGVAIWQGGVEGTADGAPVRIEIFVLTDGPSRALLIFDQTGVGGSALARLTEAVRTIDLHEVNTDTDDRSWKEPAADGRTYTSEGRASLVIPTQWESLESPLDERASDPTVPFDALGYWDIDADDPATGAPATVGLTVERFVEDGDAVAWFEETFAAPGTTIEDGSGATLTVVETGPLADPPTSSGAYMIAEILAPIDDTQSAVVAQRCHLLVDGSVGLLGCLEQFDALDPAAVATFDEAMATVRIEVDE